MTIELVTGHAGTPHITAKQQALFNRGVVHGWRSNAAILDTTRLGLLCTVEWGSYIAKITPGDGIIQGRHFTNDTVVELQLAPVPQGMQRIDLVVAHYHKDTSTDVESVEMKVITGTPASASPVEPAYLEADIDGGAVDAEEPFYAIRLDDSGHADDITPKVERIEPLERMSYFTHIFNRDTMWKTVWSSANSRIKARKIGRVVEIEGSGYSGDFEIPQGSWGTITTLPKAFRPDSEGIEVYRTGFGLSQDSVYMIQMQIFENGEIQLCSPASATSYWKIGATYFGNSGAE